jgi:TonB-dependent SusC/RagA subfamily outer membrane receptor
MRKYIKNYTFLILLLTFASNSWSQPDSLGIVLNNSDSIIKIAYGEQSKALVSSSISTISGKELIKSSVSNVGNTLYGKFPGLFVSQGAGQPGYESPNLRVRGADAAPLIIIDGFERDMTFISPDEIESVSLLKDAAAVALYGMKAINGALLITTKRGLDQKAEIDFKVQTGFQAPARTVEILNAGNYMRLHNQASLNDGLVPIYSEQDIASAGYHLVIPMLTGKMRY